MHLAATGITVSLGGRKALDGVNATLSPGEVVGLIGPNGAGKSTLQRALAGQAAFTGGIELAGRGIAAYGATERARLIAYLPQARVIGWPIAVRDVVGLGRLPWRGFGKDAAERDAELCREAMEMMDVTAFADRPATALSGGEQARVIAARAIAQDTPFLIADEPSAGLDPAHQIAMMAALRDLAGRGKAVLVSLHDLTLAARWCDRVLVLDHGRVAADGTPAQVLTQDLLRSVFGIAARIDHDDEGLIVSPTGLAP